MIEVEVPIVMLGRYSGKFSRRECKIRLSRDNLGEQKAPRERIFRLSESPKSKNLATIVLPLEYIGFITKLPFWAT